MDWTFSELLFTSWQRKDYFCVPQSIQPALEVMRFHTRSLLKALQEEGKRKEQWNWPLTIPSAVVQGKWSATSTPSYDLITPCFITHRKKFTYHTEMWIIVSCLAMLLLFIARNWNSWSFGGFQLYSVHTKCYTNLPNVPQIEHKPHTIAISNTYFSL
jgi:hypothetical protein